MLIFLSEYLNSKNSFKKDKNEKQTDSESKSVNPITVDSNSVRQYFHILA